MSPIYHPAIRTRYSPSYTPSLAFTSSSGASDLPSTSGSFSSQSSQGIFSFGYDREGIITVSNTSNNKLNNSTTYVTTISLDFLRDKYSEATKRGLSYDFVPTAKTAAMSCDSASVKSCLKEKIAFAKTGLETLI